MATVRICDKDLLSLILIFATNFSEKIFLKSAFIHSNHLHHEITGFSHDFLKKISFPKKSISQETLRNFQNWFSQVKFSSEFSLENIIFLKFIFSKGISHLSQESKSIFRYFKDKILRISIS